MLTHLYIIHNRKIRYMNYIDIDITHTDHNPFFSSPNFHPMYKFDLPAQKTTRGSCIFQNWIFHLHLLEASKRRASVALAYDLVALAALFLFLETTFPETNMAPEN